MNKKIARESIKSIRTTLWYALCLSLVILPLLGSVGLNSVKANASTANSSVVSAVAAVPSKDYKVVTYFPSWAIYDRNFQITDLEASKITHINYAFFDICWNGRHGNPATGSDNPNKKTWPCTEKTVPLQRGNVPNGTIVLGEPWADVNSDLGDKTKCSWEQSENGQCGNLARLKELKAKHPHLKTLFSVGGWTWSNRFSEMAADPTTRANFAKSAVALIREYNFDGIDIDWEYPGVEGIKGNSYSPNDKYNFTLLLQDVRKELDAAGKVDGKHYLLTLATGASQKYIDNAEMTKVMAIVDFINIMAYDFHGDWDTTTNNNAGLYKDSRDPANVTTPNYYVDGAIQVYERAGVDLSKVVLGVPVYGRGWKGCAPGPNGDGLYQPCTPGWDGKVAASGTWDSYEVGPTGNFDYGDLAANYINKNGYVRYWNDQAKVPYLYNAAKGVFISYDDPQSMKEKIAYLKAKGLGGAMYWDATSDCRKSSKYDCTGPKLLDVIATELGVDGNKPDTMPPSVPTGVTAAAITHNSVSLTWTPSTDNRAVTGYEVYQGSTLVKTSLAATTDVTGLLPVTDYSFTVKAKDAAGNVSAASTAVVVKTKPAPPADLTAPSIPQAITVAGVTYNSVSLNWNPSSDNVGVTGYDVYAGNQKVLTVTTASGTIIGLNADTAYTFTVVARDAAGNQSGSSAPISAKTIPAPPSLAVATFQVASDWGSGYDFTITIKNNGTTELKNWKLELDFASRIISVWDATLVSSLNGKYLINNTGWNGNIPAGGSVTFGGSVDSADSTVVPVNLKVIGE